MDAAELLEVLDVEDAKQRITSHESRSQVVSVANKLRKAVDVLDNLMEDYSSYYRPPKRSKLTEQEEGEDRVLLKVSDIISYSQKISYTTFAPPGSDLRGALPPAPQGDQQMRASILHKCGDLRVGLPETKIDYGITITDSEPLTEVQSLQIPPNIVVPAGWKPGMPVELPRDMPILPPPGWKPGDPVALPPLDALPVPMPPRQHPRPETIQVRHVQLDIEDEEDDLSDYLYSSDDYSSSDCEE